MTVVTISGNAWTHQGEPIPPERHPELWFRPQAHGWGEEGLLVGVEALAELDADGSFTVEVVSGPGIYYRPVMRWLMNPDEPDPQLWAYGFAEWPFLVVPHGGGPITDLVNAFPPGTIIAALGPPPDGVTNVAWIDLTDVTEEGALVYAPEGSY